MVVGGWGLGDRECDKERESTCMLAKTSSLMHECNMCVHACLCMCVQAHVYVWDSI